MAASQTQLTVMVFPGTQTLPLLAAQAQGFFAGRDLAIDLKPAPNSEEQRQGLAAGRYPIVHGAADQCVALVEGSKVDAVIVAGGDGTVNECAAGLLRSNTAMGIIPTGSGNGFARHVGIPDRKSVV